MAPRLTERYCLYTSDSKNRLYVGDIHHLPWTLQEAGLQLESNTATVHWASFMLTILHC
ncbi:DUF2071 domain-containing protein [Paenibacillus graminis]|uniref:DUF2071 domain-containing protein n=1 Tax=Paenibacillus graminis TaxID=189425 RepID=UPI0009DCD078